MKIKPEHYARLRDAMRPILVGGPTANDYRLGNIGKDHARRHRYDAFNAAKLSAWVCDNIYPYADDTHLDTALKAIVAELQP